MANRTWLIHAGSALAGPVVVLSEYLRDGMLLSPDSNNYLYGARELARGHGYLSTSGTHQSLFPPGYPAVLAAGQVLGSLEAVALVVNLITSWLVCLAVAVLIGRLTSRRWPAIAGAVVCALTPAVSLVFGYTWSEPLFTALVCWAVVAQQRRLDGLDRGGGLAAAVVLLLATAAMVRTAGLFVIVAGIAGYLVARRRRDAAVLVLALVPAGGWSLYQRLAYPQELESRGTTAFSPLSVAGNVGLTIGGWFVPSAPKAVALVAFVVVILALLAAVAAARGASLAVALPAGYAVALLLGTLAVALRVAMDPVSDRLLAPMAPLLVVVVFGLTAMSWGRERVTALQRAGLAVACAALAVGCLGTLVRHPAPADTGQQAALGKYCSLPTDGTLLSDSASRIAYTCDRAVGGSPRHLRYASKEATGDATRLERLTGQGCVRILLTKPSPSKGAYTVSELEAAGFRASPVDSAVLLSSSRCG